MCSSPKDPLRCNSPVEMETSIETMDPLGVNAPMQPEREYNCMYTSVNCILHYNLEVQSKLFLNRHKYI